MGNERNVNISHVPEVLDQAMLGNPVHWRAYYRGADREVHFARCYSYSDRSRYYWPEPAVQRELERLLANLSAFAPPLTLISQYLPEQYDSIRAGSIPNTPASLIQDRIRKVLRTYSAACGNR